MNCDSCVSLGNQAFFVFVLGQIPVPVKCYRAMKVNVTVVFAICLLEEKLAQL